LGVALLHAQPADGLNPTTTTVLQIMTHGVTYCRDDDTIEDALSTMRQTDIHHLPVPNQSNLLIGILSLSDLTLKGPRLLYPDIASVIFKTTTSHQTATSRATN
jgi:CBS domain-containing protein